MKNLERTIEFRGRELKISCSVRKGNHTAIFAIHGLGCAKESFEEMHRNRNLNNFTTVSVDLVGFGNSAKPADFSYSMQDQAKVCHELIKELGFDRVNVIGHSMGGAVGLYLVGLLEENCSAFINAEGNLVSDDCAMLSRNITEIPYEYFADGFFRGMKAGFKRSKNKSHRLWAKWAEASDPHAFYKSSLSLVKVSKTGQLLRKFKALRTVKAYFYGEHNAGMKVLEKLNGIKRVMIPDAGHFMMNENPEKFYSMMIQVLKG